MEIDQYFSGNYEEAREKFLRLSQENNFAVQSMQHPAAQGPAGSDLYMDVATLGEPDASRLLVLFSGTHGVEGYCGSGIQAALLGEGQLIEHADLQIALVHAVNPYGFAHDRRVNEDNIDLNRNFLEFGAATPSDNGYADIHHYLAPEAWDDEARLLADAGLKEYVKTHGPEAMQHAASGGQYTHPDGVFYGGLTPSWSAQTITLCVEQLAAKAQKVCLIDFHTGLGPYGYGEMIAAGSAEQVARTFAFYEGYELTDPDAGTSSSAPVQGTMAHGLERSLNGLERDVETLFVALEYGTLSMKEVMTAVRADNWLCQHGQVDSAMGSAIKRQIKDAFYCDETKWKEMVYQRALDVVSFTMQKI